MLRFTCSFTAGVFFIYIKRNGNALHIAVFVIGKVLLAAAIVTTATTAIVAVTIVTATVVTATEEKKKDYDDPRAVITESVTHSTLPPFLYITYYAQYIFVLHKYKK